jgi:hypothetical protein
MNVQTLRQLTKELLDKHPSYAEEFEALFFLALSEIEEGGSEQHECELAYNDMLNIVNNITEEYDNTFQDLAKQEELSWKTQEMQAEIDKRKENKL